MNNELKHYGVLGMRWGVRRANRNLAKARRLRLKGEKEKAKALEAKAKKSLKKHEAYSGGKSTINYTKSESLGKSILKSYLLGTYGALKYNEARAKGNDRAVAAAKAYVYAIGNNLTYGIGSIVEPRSRTNNDLLKKI